MLLVESPWHLQVEHACSTQTGLTDGWADASVPSPWLARRSVAPGAGGGQAALRDVASGGFLVVINANGPKSITFIHRPAEKDVLFASPTTPFSYLIRAPLRLYHQQTKPQNTELPPSLPPSLFVAFLFCQAHSFYCLCFDGIISK